MADSDMNNDLPTLSGADTETNFVETVSFTSFH